jgi:multidrug efflux pump subunit AcrA (membrane-fusion protein)
VIRRSELSAVYVVGSDNQPRLRQVRVGAASGDAVEILAGLRAGERVVVDGRSAVGR